MRSTIIILYTLTFAVGCSKHVTSGDTDAPPQFHVDASDVSTTSISVVTGQITANPTQEVALLHVTLSESKAGEFQKITKEHVDHKIQNVVLGKVTIESV